MMKPPPCKSISEFCQQLLGTRHPEEAVLSSYCLDEGEARRLAEELGLFGARRVLFRFDPSSFRGWGDSRLLPVKWLLSFRPMRNDVSSLVQLPAIYHPKICVLKSGRKAGIIVGSGNIGTDDQRRSVNLHCAFSLSDADSRRAIEWVAHQGRNPTLAVIASENKPAKLITTKKSSWSLFQQLRLSFKADREEWEMIAPFWSPSMLKYVSETGCSRVKAFFRDKNQAQQVAERYVRKGLECWMPAKQKRFHHKVLAWRGWHGKKCRVIIYVGSANLTSAGFLGVPPGKAYNWEAGVFLVGSSALWPTAQRAVRAGIDKWKCLHVRKRDGEASVDDEVSPKDEADRKGQLLLWLSRMIVVKGNHIQRNSKRLPLGCQLQRVSIVLDGKARALHVGKTMKVPKGIRRVHAEGLFRFEGDGSAELVEIELPEVTNDPPPLDDVKTVNLFRRLLRDNDSQSQSDFVSDSDNEVGKGGRVTLATDIRFPYREFYERYESAPMVAKTWLRNIVHTNDNVPLFWRHVAKHLSGIL